MQTSCQVLHKLLTPLALFTSALLCFYRFLYFLIVFCVFFLFIEYFVFCLGG